MQPDIDFRYFSGQFRHAVTAGQTAAHGKEGAVRQIFQIRRHLHDASHRLLDCRPDKGAGIDENQIRVFRIRHGHNRLSDRGVAERAEKTFGIHPVFGTAEALRIDAQHDGSHAPHEEGNEG